MVIAAPKPFAYRARKNGHVRAADLGPILLFVAVTVSPCRGSISTNQAPIAINARFSTFMNFSCKKENGLGSMLRIQRHSHDHAVKKVKM